MPAPLPRRRFLQVMELSPHAFHDMEEEDLRSHFLVQLNGAFTGQATGETFNFQGKDEYPDPDRREERIHRRVQILER